ncbi:MAG: histidinol-phosphate transaminase [Clostridiales bacterium]|nr:histidinol-phosphate transaminase [Clostridiales bacterium]
MSILFSNRIKDLKPYVPGRPIDDVKKEYNLEHVIKMASNENPLGCSPKAKEAIEKTLDKFNYYPDGNATALKEAIAEKFGLKIEQIQPSSGSDEMIDSISKTFLDKGDEVILADITFPRYMSTTKLMGATPVIVPLKDFTYDLEGMKKAVTDKTRLIWLCNPNNPTGTMFNEDILVSFLESIPQNIIVVYDEAYNEFVTRDDYPYNSYKFLDKYPNLIILRTFSKIYGLAALRVGYAFASKEILENIDKVRGPFNVNTLAQVAALAALEDDEFLEKSYILNKEGKEFIYNNFKDLGLWYLPSETNHIFFDTGRDANKVFIELQKRGVIIRPMFDTYARVSIGTMEENRIFIEKLKEILT